MYFNEKQIHKEVLDIIKSKYQLICTISLVQYDTRWHDLMGILDEFRNAVLEDHQRILILHHDTDYYCEQQSIGNSIYNLFKIFSEFNIPCDKIIFLTNHYGLEKEIIRASNQITNDIPPSVIYTSLWYDFPGVEIFDTVTKIESAPVTQLYHCLNGQYRAHRAYLLCALKEAELLDQAIISYHFCS